MKSQLLHGKTWHSRHSPRPHAFAYPMIWLCVDLDELPALNRSVSCFGYNRRSLFSISDSDYAGPGKIAVRQKVLDLLARENVSDAIERIDLITLPKVFGYAFNPVSFFRCYGKDGRLAVLVFEVGNTFGEKHHYVLRPNHRGGADEPIRFCCEKAFYVSPFNRVDGDYEVRWLERADSLWLEIDLHRTGQLVMTAGMSGQAVPFSTRTLVTAAFRLPWMVASVIPRISWQALQLRFRKRVPIFAKPDPTSVATIPAHRANWINRLHAHFVRLASAGNKLPHSIAPVLSLSKENLL